MHANSRPEEIVRDTRRIAIVGASPNPRRPVFDVMRYLIDAGFEVIPVRPGGGEILGQQVVASLAEIQGPIDLVDVFRRGDAAPDIAREAVSVGADALWLQPGCVSDEAREIASAAGLAFVAGECTMQVHRQMNG